MAASENLDALQPHPLDLSSLLLFDSAAAGAGGQRLSPVDLDSVPGAAGRQQQQQRRLANERQPQPQPPRVEEEAAQQEQDVNTACEVCQLGATVASMGRLPSCYRYHASPGFNELIRCVHLGLGCVCSVFLFFFRGAGACSVVCVCVCLFASCCGYHASPGFNELVRCVRAGVSGADITPSPHTHTHTIHPSIHPSIFTQPPPHTHTHPPGKNRRPTRRASAS